MYKNNLLDLKLKDFTFFSIFLSLICAIFLFLHSLIMYFYSEPYKTHKCSMALKEIISLGDSEISRKALAFMHEQGHPFFEFEKKYSNKFIEINFSTNFDSKSFQLNNSTNYGSFGYERIKFKTIKKISGIGPCIGYVENREETTFFSIAQVPISQWLFYSDNTYPLRFNREASSNYGGRIFSEKEVVFNYKTEDMLTDKKQLLGVLDKNNYTLFTNYDLDGNKVGSGIISRNTIKVRNHKINNNAIYYKLFEDFTPFKNIFDILPKRIMGSISDKKDQEFYDPFIKIHAPASGIFSKYRHINYTKWFDRLISDSEFKKQLNKLSKFNVLKVVIRKESTDLIHLGEGESAIKSSSTNFSWLRKEKGYTIDVAELYKWYTKKYNMRIPIVERSAFPLKSLYLYVDETGGKEIALKNIARIPLRTLVYFNNPVKIIGDVNRNDKSFTLIAKDFSILPGVEDNKIELNGAFFTYTPLETIHDFFNYNKVFKNIKIVLKGSLVLLNSKNRSVKSNKNRNYPSIDFFWNYKFLNEISWMNFVPSKYYLIE